MKKTLLAALALVALPLAGCADGETADEVAPATDVPAVEEPVTDPALGGVEGDATLEDPMMAEPAPMEGEVAPMDPMEADSL